MIAAGFLPACAAVWHRGALELVRLGWWSDLPGADRWPPVAWLAVPAAVITVLAVAAAATSSARALLVLIGLSAFVHPWLPLALLPLAIAVRAWPVRAALSTAAIAGGGLWLAGLLLSPACPSGVLTTVAPLQLLPAWWAVLGLAAGALLVLDLLFSHAARRAQLAVVVVLLIVAALFASRGANDVPALLGASAIVLWWRVIAGAGHVIAWQQTAAGRAGAIALVALVPVLTAARGGEALRPPGPAPSAAEIWRALETAGSPAVFMSTGGRIDTAATLWRSAAPDGSAALQFISPDPAATGAHLATSAVFAWERTAREMSMRGMLVAPVPVPDTATPLLWRVLHFEPCQPLMPSWTDIGPTAAGGQFAGVFPVPDPNRTALVYLASNRPLDPMPLEWPSEAVSGFDRRGFDRDVPADRSELDAAIARDELPANLLGESRFVARVRFGRGRSAPETLAIALGGTAIHAWARLYVAPDERPGRQPSLCRSSVGLPVVAYAGAPATVALDVTSRHSTGAGWHAPEGAEGGRFRWTGEPSADLLFLAHRPHPLRLVLQAEPASGDWATAQLGVRVNGAEATCVSGTPPCEWQLPVAAMRTGLNVISLHSTLVPAPAPDPRQLGLMVRGAELRREE